MRLDKDDKLEGMSGNFLAGVRTILENMSDMCVGVFLSFPLISGVCLQKIVCRFHPISLNIGAFAGEVTFRHRGKKLVRIRDTMD